MRSPVHSESPPDSSSSAGLPSPAATHTEPSAPLLGLLAMVAGLGVANIYYCQPLLGIMAANFHVDARTVTVVATATQLGYAAGLLLIVPLADSLERKCLIVACTLLAAAVLALVGLCSTIPLLVAASFATGVVSMAPQLSVTYAAGLASPEKRGRTVGAVMSGLLIGILLSRTVSGELGKHLGWQSVYFVAAGVMLTLAGVLALALPVQQPIGRVRYRELLRSTIPLLRTEPVLRRHALIGALGFGAFSAFWTTLAFHLARLPAHYGSDTAGLFGLVGAAGALAAAVSGRLADRVGPRWLNGSALLLIVGAFALMAVAGTSLGLLALGVVLMDAGVQGSHISNQTRIYALSAEQRNRLNAAYMVSYFLGGAAGSALGSAAWERLSWSGVCWVGGLLATFGIAVLFNPSHRTDAYRVECEKGHFQ